LISRNDPVVDKLRDEAKIPHVQKLRILGILSQAPDLCVFVFEAGDDSRVFGAWIARLNVEISFEPIFFGGKHDVLELWKLLERDKAGISRNVYFFVDRDFDDLRGIEDAKNIFMTDRYSIENYLVSPEVVDSILKLNMECNEYLDIRRSLIEIFEAAYCEFLSVTKALNFQIFCARKLQREFDAGMPERINQMATVTITEVKKIDTHVPQIFDLGRITDEKLIEELSLEFNSLVPQERFRGKFAMLFFKRWLNLLETERGDSHSSLFRNCRQRAQRKTHEVTLPLMALYSNLPATLKSFLVTAKASTKTA